MRRFKAYDPPEYLDWQPDPEVMAAWNARIDADPERASRIGALDTPALLKLYRGLLRARLYDIYLKRWVKQGVISKAWLATGEEAVTIGSVHALEAEDAVGPMIRNASACIEKGMDLKAMFSAYLATTENPTRGRDLHTGDFSRHVITPISHVASVIPMMAGVALAFKMEGTDRVALAYTGDGSTRCGEFHEGMSLAAALALPLIVVVQNNQVALGTHVSSHSAGPLSGLAQGYGVPCIEADGNHVLDVWAATHIARERAREEGAVMMVMETFRMGGHATHDEAEARKLFNQASFTAWGKRDPVGCYEAWLEAKGHATREQLEQLEAKITEQMEEASAAALAGRERYAPRPETVGDGLFA